MGVSALELRPRGAVALFDAGIRLCARSSGLWALGLPGGAIVTAAALPLIDAIAHKRAIFIPTVLFTAAWCARAIFQGASCHYLEQTLLGAKAPTTWSSLRAALGKAPSLIIASVYLVFFNLLVGTLTLGLYYFFLGSHLAGYAVTMQGKGNPLNLYSQCSRLLGPARHTAVWVRLLFSAQALVILNIHIAANVLLYVGRKLLAIDLSYAERFVSLNNSVWVSAAVLLG